MPKYIAVPAGILVGAILLAVAVGPSIWLARSRSARHLRIDGGRALALWWAGAAFPWALVMLVLHFVHRVGISFTTLPALITGIVAALVLFAALVSLPLSAMVLTLVWLHGRLANKE